MNDVEDRNQGVRRYFYFIKEEVSSDWKDLAYQLGVASADIHNIAGRNRDDKSCCMDLLEEWLKINGESATIETLMEALSNAALQITVDELKKMYPETAAQRLPAARVNRAQKESIQTPDGLKAWEITNDSVKLGWTKASSNQTDGYRLEQSIAFEHRWASAQGDRKMLPATITEFTVVDLAPYHEYHFCVRSAIDRMGELVLSERSVPLYVVTRKQYQPYRPRKIKLADLTHASLSLTWKEPSPAADVKPACCEYVVEMCLHDENRNLNIWTEYCRTTQCQCSIDIQGNGDYRFRVSANNTEKDVTSLPEEMGDPDLPICIKTRSGRLLQFLRTYWPFSATTQPTNQETGSIVFNISCHDLEGLRELWMNYKLGKVKTFFENLFARQARLAFVETDTELEIKIDKEDFYTCRRHLMLTRPTNKGFRLVRLGEGHFRGTQLGLSEDYPVYCKPISHKQTCSQLDFLDPATHTEQLGLDRTVSDDKLLALPPLGRQAHCSSLPGLDLAVVKENQSRKYRTDDISKLRAAVRTGREKSQRLEVQLRVVKTQLETGRQEIKALKKVVTNLTEEKEKAQKIALERNIRIQQLQETNKNGEDKIEGMQTARHQTEAMVLNLSKEVTRLTDEKEKAQKILQEQETEIQQLQENNKSMAATIEELRDAKHEAKGESGRKGDTETETYPGETDPGKETDSGEKEESRRRSSLERGGGTGSKDGSEVSVKARKDDQTAGISGIHSKLGFKVEELTRKEGGKTTQGSSIPLILPNDLKYNVFTGVVEKVEGVHRESLQVVPEALQLLEGIEEPVSVISICGPCRTGKSYILSRLLGTSDAFELGHRWDPKTFGIWMGTKVLRGKDFTIVLLDTEGIDAVESSAGQDARILVMTILLSSKLIYNSLNVPYKGDLEKMQCFIKLARGITVRQGQMTQISAFREFFPDFLWLLRDVSLKRQDKDGKEMDATDYLVTKVLGRKDPDAFEESTSDKVGRAILTFFSSVKCAILQRPSGDKEVMDNITQHTDSLNPEFNKGVAKLMERLLRKARAKRGYDKGSTVSGEALSIMAQQYVAAVNDPNSIPALDNTWKNTVEVLRGRAIEAAVEEYNRQMKARIAKARKNEGSRVVPLEEDETLEERGAEKATEATEDGMDIPRQPTLLDLHNASFKDVMSMLLKKVGHFGVSSENQGTDDSNTVVDQMQSRLAQRERRTVDYVEKDGTTQKKEGFAVTGGELLQYIQENKEYSRIFCQEIFEFLFNPIRHHVELPPPDYDFKQLMEEMDHARQKYVEQARGPEKWVVFQEKTKDLEKLKANFKKIKGYEEKVMQEQQKAQEAEIKAKEQAREIQQLLKHSLDMQIAQQQTLQKMEEQHKDQLEKLKQEEMKRRVREGKELADLRKALMEDHVQRIEEHHKRESSELKEIIKKLERQQAATQRQLEELLRQIHAPPVQPPPRAPLPTPPPPPTKKWSCSIS